MVYLLHFEPRYRHAGHYLGWTNSDNLDTRIDQHRKGQGSRLTQVAVGVGCTLILARTWEGGRDRERSLKIQGGASRLCPLCHAKNPGWWRRHVHKVERDVHISEEDVPF